VADRYTACQHLEILYETGNITDCGNERCKTSSAHKHTARECGCASYRTNNARIRNMFRTPCPTCLESMPSSSSRSRR
ncbi:hypothetical protein C8R45DRAFT_834019, partial [Mycena sanguinolenta]